MEELLHALLFRNIPHLYWTEKKNIFTHRKVFDHDEKVELRNRRQFQILEKYISSTVTIIGHNVNFIHCLTGENSNVSALDCRKQ